MGSGKTAVGRQLARKLNLPFADSDTEIEQRTGVDIAYIFEREGEEGFRIRECDIIDELTRTAVFGADAARRTFSKGCNGLPEYATSASRLKRSEPSAFHA